MSLEAWTVFTAWADKAGEFSISLEFERNQFAKPEVVVDFMHRDDPARLLWVQLEGDRVHVATVDDVTADPIDDGWNITANHGLSFHVAYLNAEERALTEKDRETRSPFWRYPFYSVLGESVPEGERA